MDYWFGDDGDVDSGASEDWLDPDLHVAAQQAPLEQLDEPGSFNNPFTVEQANEHARNLGDDFEYVPRTGPIRNDNGDFVQHMEFRRMGAPAGIEARWVRVATV